MVHDLLQSLKFIFRTIKWVVVQDIIYAVPQLRSWRSEKYRPLTHYFLSSGFGKQKAKMLYLKSLVNVVDNSVSWYSAKLPNSECTGSASNHCSYPFDLSEGEQRGLGQSPSSRMPHTWHCPRPRSSVSQRTVVN
jgi:hypothetical protein